tara:strand:+ start:84 stop:866 length:783 start_codon:yes stop_codon:yes gene_type:complete
MYELRRTVLRIGPPELAVFENDLSASALGYNFRSVYGYASEVIDKITAANNTKGLKGLPVYTDVLAIDADTDESARYCENKLKELGFSYTVYNTGNRGLHFHLPIVDLMGTDVIHSQIMWLKNNGLWAQVDTSIYREGGMYRLEGATHSKTGRKKTKLRTVPGLVLAVPIVKTPAPVRIKASRAAVSEDIPSERQEYFVNLTSPRDEGGRHLHFYILWKQGLRAGLSEDQIAEDILWYNRNFCYPPHHEQEVLRKIGGFT